MDFVLYILHLGLVRLRTFRLSANLSTGVDARAGEDVSFTDVKIKIPDRSARGGFWRFEKSQLS